MKSKKRPDIKVKIGIPARDSVMTGFAHSLAMLTGATGCVPGIELGVSTSAGTLICDQRDKLAQAMLDDGSDYLLFLDSDMRFPADALVRLLDRQQPIVACNYTTRRAPAEPVAFRRLATAEKLYTDEDSTGLEECAAVGLGVCLIAREVFERTPKPWFYIPYVPAIEGHWGEDVWFCNQARKAGFPTLIDHDLSKRVTHIGLREYDYQDALAVKDEVREIWRRDTEAQMARGANCAGEPLQAAG